MATHNHPWHVPHRLERVRFHLDLPGSDQPGHITASVWGESSTKRGRLWHDAGLWTEGVDDTRHAPADWLHHVALCCIQDKPNTYDRLLFSLTGGLIDQDPLF